jgi:HPt (histidine-containing phosphotransfer) domain-containing protein
MVSPPADRSRSREAQRQFLKTLPESVRALERATTEVLSTSWDEPARRRAHEMAEALAEASAALGLTDLAGVVRAIASLLKLRLEDTVAIQDALREKLVELLGMLRELRKKADESAQA